MVEQLFPPARSTDNRGVELFPRIAARSRDPQEHTVSFLPRYSARGRSPRMFLPAGHAGAVLRASKLLRDAQARPQAPGKAVPAGEPDGRNCATLLSRD